jgi:hypothetical protein
MVQLCYTMRYAWAVRRVEHGSYPLPTVSTVPTALYVQN